MGDTTDRKRKREEEVEVIKQKRVRKTGIKHDPTVFADMVEFLFAIEDCSWSTIHVMGTKEMAWEKPLFCTYLLAEDILYNVMYDIQRRDEAKYNKIKKWTDAMKHGVAMKSADRHESNDFMRMLYIFFINSDYTKPGFDIESRIDEKTKSYKLK